MPRPSDTLASEALDRTGRRLEWMDTLRGLSILLVVLHHSTQIVSERVDELPEIFVFISNFFAPYRMPMLMFLSGLLAASSIKRPAGQYLWGKIRRILWPTIVWTLIYAGANFLGGGSNQFAWYEPGFWATYLWFLQYVLVYYVLALLARWIPPWVLIALPFAGMLLVPNEVVETRFFYLMPFFFLGVFIEGIWPKFAAWLTTPWAAALSVIPLGVALYSGFVTPLWYEPLAAIPAMIGVLILARLAAAMPSARWLRPVRFTGRYSLIFYCVHYPVFAGLGRLAERAGLSDPVVSLLGILVITLAVCTGFALLGRRMPVRLLFELPRRLWPARQAPQATRPHE